MTISIRDGEYLIKQGFTKQEVNTIAAAIDPEGKPQPPVDLNTNLWQAVIRDREIIVEKIREQWFRDRETTMSRRQQDYIILQWYAQGLVVDVWDWIKFSYRRDKKITSQAVREAALRIQGLKRRINKG